MSVGELWPQRNLIRGYHLNGNSTDFSGNAKNGTDTSVTYGNQYAKFGQGASFNGSTSFIGLTTDTMNVMANGSIYLWIKPTANGAAKGPNTYSYTTFLGKGGFYLGVQQTSTNNIHLYYYSQTSPAETEWTSTGALALNQWNFLVITWTSGSMKVYINGKLDSTNSKSFTDLNTGANGGACAIGKSTNGAGDYFFTGHIDEFLIFDKVLTEKEVSNYYSWSLGRYTKIL